MIYFIHCAEADAVKIGHTTRNSWRASDTAAAYARLSQVQVNCPLELTLAGLCDGGLAEEAALHDRFAALRLRGEWFRLDDELRAHVAQFPAPARVPRGWHSQNRNMVAA